MLQRKVKQGKEIEKVQDQGSIIIKSEVQKGLSEEVSFEQRWGWKEWAL